MSNFNGSTSNASNKRLKPGNTNQPKLPRYVRTWMSGVPIAFETGQSQTKRSKDDTAVKQKKFDTWKADAEKFSWDLFAIPEDLIDSLRRGRKRTAPNVFHTYASHVVKFHGWEYIHAMTLWSLLPEEYKSDWKAAAELGGAQETSKSTPPCAEMPNFKDADYFHDGKCTYFTFQVAPEPSASRVVDTGKGNEPGSVRASFPTSQRSTCDNANGAILPTDKIVHTKDNYSGPIPLLDYLLDFEQPISPESNVQKSFPTNILNFDFGFISNFGVYSLPASNSIPPSSPDDIHDHPRPTKRQRKNPKESTRFSGYLQNPESFAPFNGLDSLFDLQVPPLSSKSPSPQGLMTQRQSDTGLDNSPTIGRETKQNLSNHQGASPSMRPRSPAEATSASASLLSYAPTSIGVCDQECGDQYHIGTCIFWKYASTIGSSQLDGDNALALDSDAIDDILSTLNQKLTAEYPTYFLLENQESSNYEFPGGFGF